MSRPNSFPADMSAADLQAWESRVFGTGYGSQVKAAWALGVPVATYRGWITERRAVPAPVVRLTQYVERFGLLDPSV